LLRNSLLQISFTLVLCSTTQAYLFYYLCSVLELAQAYLCFLCSVLHKLISDILMPPPATYHRYIA
ncbi:unnamed protein product, partial [Arabidopsis halleri]